MSIAILNKVFDEYPLSGSERTALLLLANYADDRGGSIRPSVSTIAHRLRVSVRSAQKSLRKLEAQGVISVVANQFGGKPGMVRHYKINTEMIANPLIDMSETGVVHDRGVTHDTGVVLGTRRVSFRVQDGCRPRHPIEKKEIIKNTTRKNTTANFAIPEGVDTEVWSAWLAVRKSKNAKSMSELVIKSIRREAEKAGMSLNEAITKCVEKNWISFDADWVTKPGNQTKLSDDQFAGVK